MKILVIRLRHTGDTVITSQIPYLLKKHIPEAEIHFLTYAVNQDLHKNNPYISKILTFNKKDGLSGYFKLIRAVRNEKYYAILDYQNTPRTARIIMFSKAKRKLTYDFTRRWIFYNELAPTIRGAVTNTVMSLPQKFIGESFNVTQEEKRPQIYISEKNQKTADEVIKSLGFKVDDFLITISPTHKKITRRWYAAHFADLISYLVKKYNAKIVITYGPEEDYVRMYFKESINVRFLPKMGLGDFAGVINRMKLHIGNDSGPQHIATALKIPTYVILGSSGTQWIFPSELNTWSSKGLKCQHCQQSICPISEDVPCMKEYTADEVIPHLEGFMSKVGLINIVDNLLEKKV